MTETTPLLDLPYIMPSQAQKHVTHNESLRMLDALVHLRVGARGVDTPPADPAEGDRLVVGAAPSEAFAGQAGNIAAFQDGAWAFYTPRAGWVIWDAAESALLVFDGAAWKPVFDPQNLPLIGVNTQADETNRLAVRGDATLLSHDGAGHQLKINKAATGDTGSLLFQTGWSGRAEMGLTGDDDFSIKVSPDGLAWHGALTVDHATGRVGIGAVTPATALDVDGIIRASTGFRIGNATLQNGANSSQLNTSAHFSTTGLFAIGTTPANNYYLRIRLPDASAERRAIYAYAEGSPIFVVLGDARTGIGTSMPAASAQLEVASTTKGFLPPRMTTAQRDAIPSPAEGLIVYNTTAHEPQVWTGAGWVGMAG